MRVTMAALMRAPARSGAHVAAPRKTAVRKAGALVTQTSNRLAGTVFLPARRLRAVVAAAGEDGYASSDDPEVASGKRKAPSAMNLKDLQAEARPTTPPPALDVRRARGSSGAAGWRTRGASRPQCGRWRGAHASAFRAFRVPLGA